MDNISIANCEPACGFIGTAVAHSSAHGSVPRMPHVSVELDLAAWG
jgi:hypothetical protein